MPFYVSIVPDKMPSGADLAARSQLLKECRVGCTDRQTWVEYCGWMPIFQAEEELAPEVAHVLELRPATAREIEKAKGPGEMPWEL